MSRIDREIRQRRDQNNGFSMGMICALVVLNDVFDFDEDALQEFKDDVNILLEDICKRGTSTKYVMQELDKMIDMRGIKFVF